MVYHNPDFRWEAAYETDKHDMYTVPDTKISECPVSYISPASRELVQIVFRSQYATAAPLFGTDLSKWPIWAMDVLVTVEQERIKEHNARFDAEQENQG